MKKIIKLSLILLIIMFGLMGTAYAATTCDLVLSNPSKSEYSKGEEFTIDVSFSGMKTDLGVIALDAVVKYDDSLELIEMVGKNGWEDPAGLNYNEESGQIIITNNSPEKNNKVIFTMKFKVINDSKSKALIEIKEISGGDGDKPFKIKETSKSINIKTGSVNPGGNTNTTKPDTNTVKPNTNSTNTNNTTNTPNNNVNTNNIANDNKVPNTNNGNSGNNGGTLSTNKVTNGTTGSINIKQDKGNTTQTNNNQKASELPYTGEKSNAVIVIIIGTVVLASAVLLIKIRKHKEN